LFRIYLEIFMSASETLGGREVRFEFEPKQCHLKIKGGREVHTFRFVWFTSSNFDECVKKTGR
jgi:hypothetical protein